MKPVWKFFILVAEAILSAVKAVFGSKPSDSEK